MNANELAQRERDLSHQISTYLRATSHRTSNPSALDIVRARELQTDRSLLDIQIELVGLHAAVKKLSGQGDSRVKEALAGLAAKWNSPEYMDAFLHYANTGKVNAELTSGSDEKGGYTVPAQLMEAWLRALDTATFVRRISQREFITRAGHLSAGVLQDEDSDAAWLAAENETLSEDTSTTFEGRQFIPHLMGKFFKISRNLRRTGGRAFIDRILSRMALHHARPQEKAFLIGSGVGQPLGIFTASAQGISTARDVSEGNTIMELTHDGLVNALFSLEAQYQPGAVWVMHRDVAKQVHKQKGGNGRPIYVFGKGTDQTDTLLGKPVYLTEYGPNTFTTGKYLAVVGDFHAGYVVVDGLQLDIQILEERFSETHEVGVIGRSECDGGPYNEKAFARVKLA